MRLGTAAFGEQSVNFLAGNHHPGILQDRVTRGVELTIPNHSIDRHSCHAQSARRCRDRHVITLTPAHILIIPNNLSGLCKLDKILGRLYSIGRLCKAEKDFRNVET